VRGTEALNSIFIQEIKTSSL